MAEETNGTGLSDTSAKDGMHFSQHWFEKHVRADWEHLAPPISLNEDGTPKRVRILEIGSFEGASTTWLLQNIMDHPDSTLVAVDTFEGGMEHQNPEEFDEARTRNYELSGLEARFVNNVSKCKNFEKLKVIKALSSQALLQLLLEKAEFDFIYIDGSHVAFDVLSDAVMCWSMLQVNGVMVFDDSRWKGYVEDCYNPRVAIMSFIQCVKQEVKVKKETKCQIWVTKVPCFLTPTPNADPAIYYWDDNYLRYTSYP